MIQNYISLSLFRIFLGVLTIVDFCDRIQHIPMFYTSKSILTSEIARNISKFSQNYLEISTNWIGYLSPIFYFDSYLSHLIILISGLIAALLLIAGFRPNLAALYCWLINISYINRFPLDESPGIYVLNVFLFLSCMLPFGSYFSFKKSTPLFPKIYKLHPSVLSLTCFLFLTVFVAGVLKFNDAWLSGKAVFYLLRISSFQTSFSEFLLSFPVLTIPATYGVHFMEIVIPIMAIAYFPKTNKGILLKGFSLIFFAIFFSSIRIFSSTGIITFLVATGFLIFIPDAFWRLLLPSNWLNELPNTNQTSTSRVVNIEVIACLIFSSIFLVGEYYKTRAYFDDDYKPALMPPQSVLQAIWLLEFHNVYYFFADLTDSIPNDWLYAEANTIDGKAYNAFTGQSSESSMHELPTEQVKGLRMRRVLRYLFATSWGKKNDNLRKNLGDFLCRHHPIFPANQVTQIKIYGFVQDNYDFGGKGGEVRSKILYSQDCQLQAQMQ